MPDPLPSTPERRRLAWWPVCVTVVAQMAYPLVSGAARDTLTLVTVCAGFVAAATHAALTRGPRIALLLVAVTAGGGFLVEAVGTATAVPFGAYAYAGSLGPRLWGVPWVIPLAWTMMAWPAWLVAGRLVGSAPGAGRTALRVGVAGWALASWDLFLDPQMVAAGHWSWTEATTALPGVPGVPLTNYAGWLVVALAMAALLSRISPPRDADRSTDRPMWVFYLWTYASSGLAHAVFFGLPGSAVWGAVGMGLVAVPLAVTLLRGLRARHEDPAPAGLVPR